MSESKSGCNYLSVSQEDLTGVDRVIYAGRRGTGKTTALKLFVAGGRSVIWLARTKARAEQLPLVFVPPAVRGVLPTPEVIQDGETPLFSFGDGFVRVVPYTMITALRDTGIDVNGEQAEFIISDEIIRPDGRYIRNEPKLIDDLAATVGRSGDIPRIICACNPEHNRQPYSYDWRVDFLTEGLYTYNDKTTRVVGTAHCKDCFGKKIGLDATKQTWCAHLDSGGEVISVNGNGLRLRWVGGWLYVGVADGGRVLMRDNVYAPVCNTARGAKFLTSCKQAHMSDCVVFDSFEAQMRFYTLLRLRA